MAAYYNELDLGAAAWLRELIKQGLIADGEVDTRSIEDVTPKDLNGFTQCHFFAGVAGWSLALRLAGVSDDTPIWTGSCPCQPFSAAGKGDGFADERHLWPHLHYLIEQCRPATVVGEQVASKDGLGWLDLVLADLEATGYAVGAADLCAAGIGAPHIRQRLYWVADSFGARLEGLVERPGATAQQWPRSLRPTAESRKPSWMALCEFCKYEFDTSRLGRYGCPNCEGDGLGGMADASGQRLDGLGLRLQPRQSRQGDAEAGWSGQAGRTDPTDGFWRNADWLACRDGKWRPVESAILGLVDGLPGVVVPSGPICPASRPLAKDQERRVMRLKGYGNAIVPQLAAEFIRAYLDTKNA